MSGEWLRVGAEKAAGAPGVLYVLTPLNCPTLHVLPRDLTYNLPLERLGRCKTTQFNQCPTGFNWGAAASAWLIHQMKTAYFTGNPPYSIPAYSLVSPWVHS
jgi:hypothetical protein